jgi:hypothetical protein
MMSDANKDYREGGQCFLHYKATSDTTRRTMLSLWLQAHAQWCHQLSRWHEIFCCGSGHFLFLAALDMLPPIFLAQSVGKLASSLLLLPDPILDYPHCLVNPTIPSHPLFGIVFLSLHQDFINFWSGVF